MILNLFGIENFWLFLLEFIVAAYLILFAGKRLAIYGDKLAEKSKLSSGWIGFILLASITSLPELFTGISATGIVGSVDLLIGDVIGSNAFNIVILACMFFFSKKVSIKFQKMDFISVFCGLFLLGLVGIFIIAGKFFDGNGISDTGLTWVSIGFSVFIAAAYFYTLSIVYKTGGLKEEISLNPVSDKERVGWKFALYTVIIIIVSVWITQTSDFIANTPIGASEIILGQTLVGGILLAVATSLPELAVTVSAARLGNISMAIGNIFGSNVFNIFIIPVSAIFYRGNFWLDLTFTNIFWVMLTLILTGIIGVDLISKEKLSKTNPGFLNFFAIVVWLAGILTIFLAR
jgi:cation:H+ antiporter